VGISLSAFARLRGVTPSAVSQAVRRGILQKSVLADGTIDADAAMVEWDANTSPYRGGSGRSGADLSNIDQTIRGARAMREAYEAKLAELEYKRKIGEVVPVQEMRDSLRETGRRVGERLSVIAARVTPVVAGLGGRHEDIYAAIEAEVNEVRDELARLGESENGKHHA